MTENKCSNHKDKRSRMLKKIGITFIIPISLSICGALIILSSTWNLLTQSYSIGYTLFSKPPINLNEVSFNINNEVVYRPSIGDVFATLKIASLDFEKPIIHGDSPNELRKGIGHYAGSTIPGEKGNVVLAGHRDTVFRPIEKIKEGDEILIETNYGNFKYVVSSIRITDPKDTSVTAPTDKEQLTIYTCYPFNFIGNAPNRFIVVCDFISTES